MTVCRWRETLPVALILQLRGIQVSYRQYFMAIQQAWILCKAISSDQNLLVELCCHNEYDATTLGMDGS